MRVEPTLHGRFFPHRCPTCCRSPHAFLPRIARRTSEIRRFCSLSAPSTMPVPRLDQAAENIIAASEQSSSSSRHQERGEHRCSRIAQPPSRSRRFRPIAVCSTAPVRLRRYRATYVDAGIATLPYPASYAFILECAGRRLRPFVFSYAPDAVVAANSISHDLGQRLSSITNERISASPNR